MQNVFKKEKCLAHSSNNKEVSMMSTESRNENRKDQRGTEVGN